MRWRRRRPAGRSRGNGGQYPLPLFFCALFSLIGGAAAACAAWPSLGQEMTGWISRILSEAENTLSSASFYRLLSARYAVCLSLLLAGCMPFARRISCLFLFFAFFPLGYLAALFAILREGSRALLLMRTRLLPLLLYGLADGLLIAEHWAGGGCLFRQERGDVVRYFAVGALGICLTFAGICLEGGWYIL